MKPMKRPMAGGTEALLPQHCGMEKVLELTEASNETFFYRGKHKRVIHYRVIDGGRWDGISGPLLYAVTDQAGVVRYVGKWVSESPLRARWIRHDKIHHAEKTRNHYLRELDSRRGPLSLWSIYVRELKPHLPEKILHLSEKEIAAALEAVWIHLWRSQLHWNERGEMIPDGILGLRDWKTAIA